MPTPSTDRRVNRTRRQLRDAFLSLVLEKGYDSVSVQDVTDRADLGRTTFYLHYRDKEELLLESIETLATELKTQVDLSQSAAANHPTERPARRAILLTFQHASQNSDLYRIILTGGAAPKALNWLRDILTDAVRQFIEMRYAETLKPASVPLEIFINYFSSALLGFLTWWLEKGMPYTPEEMSVYFLDMYFNGAHGQFSPDAEPRLRPPED